MTHRTYKKFYQNGQIQEQKVTSMKYIVSLTAFTLEDYGQVVIQYYFYERYSTEASTLTKVNAGFMVLLSFKTFIDYANYSVSDENGNYM